MTCHPVFNKRSINHPLFKNVVVATSCVSSVVFISTASKMTYETGINWHSRKMGNSSLAIPLISLVSSNCACVLWTNERSPRSTCCCMNSLEYGLVLSPSSHTSHTPWPSDSFDYVVRKKDLQ